MNRLSQLRNLLWLAVIFKRRAEQKILRWLIRSELRA